MQPWVKLCLQNSRETAEQFVRALADAGVRAEVLESNCSSGPGIFLFDVVTDSLLASLRFASERGTKRIIAVSVSRSSISGPVVWNLLNAGASDVLAWEPSGRVPKDIAAQFDRWQRVDDLLRSSLVTENLIGSSPVWINALRQIVEVAFFSNAPVLITGESGTGKELVARLIHTLDQRQNKGDLVLVDCTTIVPELSGSEFFGHERGAFTGAVGSRDGAFSLANGGTLFLDEVGELSIGLQAELLRVIQEGTYKRVGSNDWKQTMFRLVCATNRNLPAERDQGSFRNDLYYRIAAWSCALPPLRDRSEDILPLVQHFLEQFSGSDRIPELDPAVQEYFLRRPYPGNIRELRQLVARIMSRHVGKSTITVGDIPDEDRLHNEGWEGDWRSNGFEQSVRRAVSLGVGLKQIGRDAEDIAVYAALQLEGGNIHRAAQKLGVTDRTLQLRRASTKPVEEQEVSSDTSQSHES